MNILVKITLCLIGAAALFATGLFIYIMMQPAETKASQLNNTVYVTRITYHPSNRKLDKHEQELCDEINATEAPRIKCINGDLAIQGTFQAGK